MNRILKITAVIAAGAFVAAFIWILTGRPLYWTKGIVVADSCKPLLEDFVCEVELVPDGMHVSAQSSVEIVGGTWVELRAWESVISGRSTYTVVQNEEQ